MGKNKDIKKAVALRYNPARGGHAPKVVAKRAGTLAEKIIETAIKNGIPVEKDSDLVEVLSKLNIEEEIPPDVYVAVAELLAFIYSLNRKKQPE